MKIDNWFHLMSLLFFGTISACSEPNNDIIKKPLIDFSDQVNIEKILEEYVQENPEIVKKIHLTYEEKNQQRQILNYKEVLLHDVADYSIGPDDAEVTVVEFFDYYCPFCKSSVDFIEALPKKYPGKVRVVFKEHAILSDQSRAASLAALAAGRQGKYIEMHTALLRANFDIGEYDLGKIAKDIGLDILQWEKDINDEAFQVQIDGVRNLADVLQIRGVPEFIVNDKVVSGADTQQLITVIESAINE